MLTENKNVSSLTESEDETIAIHIKRSDLRTLELLYDWQNPEFELSIFQEIVQALAYSPYVQNMEPEEYGYMITRLSDFVDLYKKLYPYKDQFKLVS